MRLLSGGEDLSDALVADVAIRKDAHQAGARGGCAELSPERLIVVDGGAIPKHLAVEVDCRIAIFAKSGRYRLEGYCAVQS
jgi:hypothetical protein